MPRTLDSMVHNQQVASARIRAGKTVWDYRVEIPLTDDMSFKQKRNAFAKGLEDSRWFTAQGVDESSELWVLWDEIKDAEPVEHFDAVLDAIYDLADEDRCWLTLR